MNKKLFIASLAIALGFTACVKDDPNMSPQEESPELHIDASSGATNLHQLEKADFTAAGTLVNDAQPISWFVDGKQVATGKSYSFSSTLPGEFEIAVRIGSKEYKKKYGVRPRFDKGVFLLNEGNYGNETGTLTYLNAKHKVIVDSAFYRINGKRLGNVCQDLAFANDKIYIISQNGAKNKGEGHLVIAEAKSLKFISAYSDATLTAITPKHIAVVGDQIYLGTPSKGIYKGTAQGGFAVIKGTEKALDLRMVTIDNHVFALTTDNKVLMIEGDKIIATLNLAKGEVTGLALSNDGSLYLAYGTPNTIAKIGTTAKDFRILESHDINVNLSIKGQWGLNTATSQIFAHGSKIYITDYSPNIYVHDFATKKTELYFTVKAEGGKKSLNKYYNSLGVDDMGNILYAGFDDWGTYKDNATLILNDKKESVIYKNGVNSFPAGFYTIPHKSKHSH